MRKKLKKCVFFLILALCRQPYFQTNAGLISNQQTRFFLYKKSDIFLSFSFSFCLNNHLEYKAYHFIFIYSHFGAMSTAFFSTQRWFDIKPENNNFGLRKILSNQRWFDIKPTNIILLFYKYFL